MAIGIGNIKVTSDFSENNLGRVGLRLEQFEKYMHI